MTAPRPSAVVVGLGSPNNENDESRSRAEAPGVSAPRAPSAYQAWLAAFPVRSRETIVSAALLVDGEIWTLPSPTRHHTLLQAWASAHYKDGQNGRIGSHEQGFVTSWGRFVARDEAARIAHAAGQIPEPKASLFSEDVW